MEAETLSGLRNLYAEYKYAKYKPRKPDADPHPVERGWMIPYLLRLDELTWHRWDYWYKLQTEKVLPPEPIPQIQFVLDGVPTTHGRRMWESAFNCVAPEWQGWSSRTYIEYVLDWLLFGFGHTHEPPKEPRPGVSDRLYQVFDLWPLILWPRDDLGDIFAEMAIGKHAGFYPTPHSMVALIVGLLNQSRDARLETIYEPCVGTGRMLLLQSNYSLNLIGQDVSDLVIKACLVNGFLYAPWMVRPIGWCWEHADRPVTESGKPAVPGIHLSRRAQSQVKKGQGILI